MSSARSSKPKARASKDGVSKRASSIARSIALSSWANRLATFILLDVALCVALAGTFVHECLQQIPEQSRADIQLFEPGQTVFWRANNPGLEDDALVFAAPVRDADGAIARGEAGSGAAYEYVFPLSDLWNHALPVGIVALSVEAVVLLSGVTEARRIRRRLRPLNELALTAEAIGSATAEPVDSDALAHLEHAIETASVDMPRVSTGDKDLQSIEIALNGLLRRMQEAKLQQMRFVSDASHELRTPIAVVRGYVDMLDRWGKTDEAVLDESIAALKAETAHMQELVEQLLFLARGDSGRQAMTPEAFDLGALVEEVAEESRMIDAQHAYTVHRGSEARGNAPAELIVADRAMVKQALRIIVSNAARYSPPGTAIELGSRIDPTRDMHGCFVEDHGMGMTQNDVAHVFERFYRADAARSEHKDGTGLGLAVAKWIVDAHGGKIDVLTREGLGTRFTVWLPDGRRHDA